MSFIYSDLQNRLYIDLDKIGPVAFQDTLLVSRNLKNNIPLENSTSVYLRLLNTFSIHSRIESNISSNDCTVDNRIDIA